MWARQGKEECGVSQVRIGEACLKPPEEVDARQVMSSWRAPRDRGTQAAQPAGALQSSCTVGWTWDSDLHTLGDLDSHSGPKHSGGTWTPAWGQSLLRCHLLRSLADPAHQASRFMRWKSTRSRLALGTMRL